MISYGRQSITEEDIQAVVKTLKSDFLTQGPEVLKFEKSITDYCGAKYCVVVANGTAALHMAVAALNIPEGSQGLTSTNTFDEIGCKFKITRERVRQITLKSIGKLRNYEGGGILKEYIGEDFNKL